MTKINQLASQFVQQHKSNTEGIVRGPINAFNALFAVNPLDEKEDLAIERIFVDGYEPGILSEHSVSSDLLEIKRLTQELKAIKKQEMILIGERIYQAREIFKKYKERSFRDWVELTFGSFKTGYNYLAFYDLHTALPVDLREDLKKMPAKAVYILASNRAPLIQKAEFVKEHANKSSSSLLSLIRETLGSGDSGESKKTDNLDKILRNLQKEVSNLCKYHRKLSIEDQKMISFFIDRLHEVIDKSV